MNSFYNSKSCLSSTLFSGGIIARLFILCALLTFIAFSISAQTNTLASGTYYIRKPGTNLYLTRGSTAALTFQAFQSDRSVQRFVFSHESNGRYKIVCESPGSFPGYVNESMAIGAVGSTYDATWHTYTIYYSGANNLYAIQTAENAKNTTSNASTFYVPVNSYSFFAIKDATNVTGKHGVGQAGTTTDAPLSYPFELVPYTATGKTVQNITFNALTTQDIGAADFDPGATASSALPVTYTSSNTSVATIVDGKVHVVGGGYTYIKAVQEGDATYDAAEATQLLKVNFPASLTTYYKFEDNLNDAQGFYPSATAVGIPMYVVGATSGKAISLNGTTDYVKLPSGVASYDAITVAAYVKWNVGGNTTGAPYQRIFDFANNKGNNMFLTPSENSAGGGKIRFGIRLNTGTEQNITTTTAGLLPANTWTHIVLTFSAGSAKIYVNGVAQATNTTTFTIKPSDLGITAENAIGRSQYADKLFNGIIDDFRIYNYALSSSEVATLAATVLPVSLSGAFKAKLQENGSVNLNWTTASESNNSYFILERGDENKDFVKIATVNSKGNSGAYSFTDNNVQNGINYYRLSQVDKDGTSKEIGLEQVSASLAKATIFNIYPNPVKSSSFTINYVDNGAAKVSVKITDLTGNEVYQNVFPVNASGLYTIHSGSLNAGVYVITINNTSKKIIKE